MTKYFPKSLYWILGLAMFFLPVNQFCSIICFVLLFLIWIQQRSYLNLKTSFKDNSYLWLFTGFYLLHLLGLAWSSNMNFAFKDLGIKFTFLFFPLVLGSLSNLRESKDRIFKGFISGCTLACFLCLAIAIHSYSADKNIDSFFYIYYSKFMHPTYFTMYLNLAILILLKYFVEQVNANKKQVFLILSLISFLFVNILLLSARTAIASTLLTVPFIFYAIAKERQQLKNLMGKIIFIGVFFLIAFISLMRISYRYKQVEDVVMHDASQPEIGVIADSSKMAHIPDKDFNSTNLRLNFLWPMSFEVFRENLVVGVGTGDVKDKLFEKYDHSGFNYGIRKKLNSHNQYLQTGIALGLPGLILLLLSFLIPLKLALKRKEWIYTGFLLIILINAITESILEIQNGVLFYAFFNSYFYVTMKRQGE